MQRIRARGEKPLFLYKTIGGVTFVTFVVFIQGKNAARARGCGAVEVSDFLAPKRHYAGASHADGGTPNRVSPGLLLRSHDVDLRAPELDFLGRSICSEHRTPIQPNTAHVPIGRPHLIQACNLAEQADNQLCRNRKAIVR